MRVTLLFFILITTPLLAAPKYYLSMVAIFRDEARFLREWIEYHRMIGVEHFYLFNHLSQDDYYPTLQPYIEEGIVELFHWPYEITSYPHWAKIQCGTYNKIINERKEESLWIAVIDTDDFIQVIDGSPLPELLREYENYGGLGINWITWGCSHVWRIPDRKTLIGNLIYRAEEGLSFHKSIKSIIQPKKVSHFFNPHYPKYNPPFFAVTENKEKMERYSTPYISINKVRLNHYIFIDEEFFYTVKCARNEKQGRELPKLNPLYDVVEDHSMKRYVPELENRLFNND